VTFDQIDDIVGESLWPEAVQVVRSNVNTFVCPVIHLPLPTPSPGHIHKISKFRPPRPHHSLWIDTQPATLRESRRQTRPEKTACSIPWPPRVPLFTVAHGPVFIPCHGPVAMALPLNSIHVSSLPGHRTCNVFRPRRRPC